MDNFSHCQPLCQFQLFLHPYQNKLEKIVLFRWNRVYPADTWLDLSLDEEGWHLVNCQEFSGSSHKTITQEVYEK